MKPSNIVVGECGAEECFERNAERPLALGTRKGTIAMVALPDVLVAAPGHKMPAHALARGGRGAFLAPRVPGASGECRLKGSA